MNLCLIFGQSFLDTFLLLKRTYFKADRPHVKQVWSKFFDFFPDSKDRTSTANNWQVLSLNLFTDLKDGTSSANCGQVPLLLWTENRSPPCRGAHIGELCLLFMFSPNSFPSNIVHVFAGCLRMKFWTILANLFIFVAQSALFGALFTGLDNVLVY